MNAANAQEGASKTTGNIQADPRFNLNDFLKQNGSLITTLAVILAGVAILWSVHASFVELNYRQGKTEGMLEIILQDRQNMLKVNSESSSSPLYLY